MKRHQPNKSDSNTAAARIRVAQATGVPYIDAHQEHVDQLRNALKHRSCADKLQFKRHQPNTSDSNTTTARIRVDQDTGVPSERTRGMLTSFETLPSARRDARSSENRSCADKLQVKRHQPNKSDSNTTATRIRVDQDTGLPSARTRGMLTSFETLSSTGRALTTASETTSTEQKRFEHNRRSDSARSRYRSPIGAHQGHVDQL